MQINAKEFGEWTEEDMFAIIHNEAYKENEFIDYKENFAPLECLDKMQKKKKQDEFRHDICSFANSNGGFLLFGIKEEAGVPVNISGISIDNIDKFELDRRNELSGILPIVPNVAFSFVLLKNDNYIVIIKVSRGLHRPYINLENEGVFKFFVRHGNRKRAMSYMEIQSYFLQSGMLSDEIKKFRKDRLKYYQEEYPGMPFAMIHVMPGDFLNDSAQVDLYDVYVEKRLNGHELFDRICFGTVVPNVDGICFPGYNYDTGLFLQLYNNGVTELFYRVEICERQEEKGLYCHGIVDRMTELLYGTMNLYVATQRQSVAYVCVTIAGCKGLWSVIDHNNDYYAKVDRNEIHCMPIEIKEITDEKYVNEGIEKCRKIIGHALGKKTESRT